MGLIQNKSTLDNGVRVVTELMPDVRSLAIGIVVNVGSKNETPATGGMAHVIEHMLFKGTHTRSAATLGRMIDMAGGQMGAFTTRDYTVLHAAVLDDYRTYALDIFGDVLLNALFDSESLERERSVILQEIAVSNEQPDKLALDTLKSQTWADHPLGQPIYSWAENVAHITQDSLIDFYRKHYIAENVIVAAAGNIDHLDFVAHVQDALWALPGRDTAPLVQFMNSTAREHHRFNAEGTRNTVTLPVEIAPSPPLIDSPVFHAGVTLVSRPLGHIYFALGVSAPAYTDPDRYSVFVLNSILGGGISSRLYRTLRDEQGWVYEIGSSYHPYQNGGMLVIEGVTTPANLLPVMQAIIEQVIDVQSVPVEAEELWRAQEHLRGEILMGAESTNTRMSQLATQELYFGRFLPLPEIVAGISEVTSDSVCTMAEALFQPGSLSLAAVGPFDDSSAIHAALSALLGTD